MTAARDPDLVNAEDLHQVETLDASKGASCCPIAHPIMRAFGGWADEAPFVTAYIDLKEGDRMFTVLRGVDATKPDLAWVGKKVKVEFDEANEAVSVPFWRLA